MRRRSDVLGRVEYMLTVLAIAVGVIALALVIAASASYVAGS